MIMWGVRVNFGNVRLVENGIANSIGTKQTWEEMLNVLLVKEQDFVVVNKQ